MFSKPNLFYRSGKYDIYTPIDQANQLRLALTAAGFMVKQLNIDYTFEDLNSDRSTKIIILELHKSTDKLKLRKFLQEWIYQLK